MTEEEKSWLETDLPELMLDFELAKRGKRKLWLYGCACLRRSFLHLNDRQVEIWVDLADRVVDGYANEQDVDAALQRVEAESPVATRGRTTCFDTNKLGSPSILQHKSTGLD